MNPDESGLETQSVNSEDTIYHLGHNVQGDIIAVNDTKNGNPAGGTVRGKGISIDWQNGARAEVDQKNMNESNGAFVEDALWASLQRLQYFQNSQYKCRENAMAITHIEEALGALTNRRLERKLRSVEGKHIA